MAKQKQPVKDQPKRGPKKKPFEQKKSRVLLFLENSKIEANGGLEACQIEGEKLLSDRADKLTDFLR